MRRLVCLILMMLAANTMRAQVIDDTSIFKITNFKFKLMKLYSAHPCHYFSLQLTFWNISS